MKSPLRANSGPLSYYENVTADPGAWLLLTLTTSNDDRLAPDGFGVRVTVTTGTETQVRLLDGGNNYLATSEVSVHVGLSDHAVIDEILIEWPNGRVNRLEGVAVSQTMTVAPCFHPGDANGDRTVDFDDLNQTLGNWGAIVSPFTSGDANGDGQVNFDDLNLVLGSWGTGC